jgi:hypothetical protein
VWEERRGSVCGGGEVCAEEGKCVRRGGEVCAERREGGRAARREEVYVERRGEVWEERARKDKRKGVRKHRE